jgi:hypothetical protein
MHDRLTGGERNAMWPLMVNLGLKSPVGGGSGGFVPAKVLVVRRATMSPPCV